MLLTRQLKTCPVRKTLQSFKLRKGLTKLNFSRTCTSIRSFSQPKETSCVFTETPTNEIQCYADIDKKYKNLRGQIETLKTNRIEKHIPDTITLTKLVDLVEKQNELSSQIVSMQIKNHQSFETKLVNMNYRISNIVLNIFIIVFIFSGAIYFGICIIIE